MPQTLTTERLTLRAPRMSDAADIVCAVDDREVTKWLTQLPYPYTHADAVDFISCQTSGKTFMMAIDEVVIGCIGTQGEFGYWLGRSHWGQGLMTEASNAVLNWHFTRDAENLQSGHAIGNERSRRVLLKMGFEDTAVVDRTHTITGEVRKQQVMVLTHDAWDRRA